MIHVCAVLHYFDDLFPCIFQHVLLEVVFKHFIRCWIEKRIEVVPQTSPNSGAKSLLYTLGTFCVTYGDLFVAFNADFDCNLSWFGIITL